MELLLTVRSSIANLGPTLNPWALIQFAHNQTAAVVTGSFVVAAVGALYALRGVHPTQARLYLGAGTLVGLIASVVVAFPTGDQQARMVGDHQPVTLAAMEGKFVGGPMAGVSVIGQPNIEERRLDNPIEIPGALSFLAYGTFQSYVHGLGEYPHDTWPDNIELLYYSFHLMITLGTIFIVSWPMRISSVAQVASNRTQWLLWVLMLAFPFPLHRQHAWVDDCGAWTSTLACLRLVPHTGGLQQGGEQRRHDLHADRVYRPLFCFRLAFSLPGGTRDRSRAG